MLSHRILNLMNLISITNDEKYEFIKFYDILRDMDFELTDNQVSVFEKIEEVSAPTEPDLNYWEGRN